MDELYFCVNMNKYFHEKNQGRERTNPDSQVHRYPAQSLESLDSTTLYIYLARLWLYKTRSRLIQPWSPLIQATELVCVRKIYMEDQKSHL